MIMCEGWRCSNPMQYFKWYHWFWQKPMWNRNPIRFCDNGSCTWCSHVVGKSFRYCYYLHTEQNTRIVVFTTRTKLYRYYARDLYICTCFTWTWRVFYTLTKIYVYHYSHECETMRMLKIQTSNQTSEPCSNEIK